MTPINPNGTFRFDFFKRPICDVTKDTMFQLTKVKLNHVYDADNKPTDIVQDITYNIFIPDLMSQISIKVNATTPIISPEQLDAAMESGQDVYVEIPTDEVYIKPYKSEKGGLLVSIKTPYIKLAKD